MITWMMHDAMGCRVAVTPPPPPHPTPHHPRGRSVFEPEVMDPVELRYVTMNSNYVVYLNAL
jgi:hypothetical protein